MGSSNLLKLRDCPNNHNRFMCTVGGSIILKKEEEMDQEKKGALRDLHS